jgi:hypothetical protein
MQLADVGELFYITAIENVDSMLRRGILSHHGAQGIRHATIYSDSVQRIRARIRIPGGRRLHEYANLYFCQRNPMMFVLTRSGAAPHDTLAVLRVDPAVLHLPDVVIADGNAARAESGGTRFDPVGPGLARLDGDMVHAEFWTGHATEKENWEHKRVKHAEVLVPDLVKPDKIVGAYASCADSGERLRAIMPTRDVKVVPYVFFR